MIKCPLLCIFSCVPQESLWLHVSLWVVGGARRTPGAEASTKSQEPPSRGVALLCLNQPEHLRCGCSCSCFHGQVWFLAEEERGKAARFTVILLPYSEIHGRDIWILWFACDAWNCSSFLGAPGLGRKSLGAATITAVLRCSPLGATLPVVYLLRIRCSWMMF